MPIPPSSESGRRIWLAIGRFLGAWTLAVPALILAAFIVLLALHFAGVIELGDS